MATVRLIPSAYSVSNATYVTFSDSSHPASNMYANTDSTTYATIRGRNSSQTSRLYDCYINGFNFGSVPSNAEVSSFSIKIKAYKNSYQRTGETYRPSLASTASNSSIISGTTLTSDLSTTSDDTVYTFPTSSLTWNNLASYGSDFTIVIPLNPSSNQYPYGYVYGAEIEVTYTIPVYHDVTASSSASGVTVTPASQTILEGNNATVNISSSGGTFTVTDNNVDVTNQLVQLQPTGSSTTVPSGYINLSSGVTINSSYPIGNAYDNADDTTDYVRLDYNTSTTGYIELTFSIPAIPAGATLTGVSARARLRISSTTRMTNRICQLYSGSTAKGSNTDFSSTASGGSLVTLSTGTWTASELNNLIMRIGATSSSSTSSKYVYIYGADITVSYTLAGETYTYTISNVTADHTIVITAPVAQDVLYVKVNGSWVAATAVYKKVNGSWVQQTNLTNVFDSGTNYKVGS